MLLYQLLGLFHREEQRKSLFLAFIASVVDLLTRDVERLLSHTFHGALVSMLRQLELPRRIKQTQLVMPHALMQGDELDAAWKTWIEVETRRR